MQKLSEFFKHNHQAIKWTICYIVVMWAILQGMFNFCIFSYSDWNKLIHAELHGFAGFVFGILILAALPLYIATTVLVVRNDAPLFKPDWSKIPFLPKLLKLFTPTTDTPAEATTTTAEPQPEPAAQQPTPEPLPDGLPMEMRATFMRARHSATRPQVSSFDMSHLNVGARPDEVAARHQKPEPVMEMAAQATASGTTTDLTDDALPLPADFDLPAPDEMTNTFDRPDTAPVFTEINFDDTTPSTPTTQTADTEPVIKYLKSKSIDFKQDSDIIITPTLAIASHTSNDFWIADDDTWFATGVSRPSPVAAAINAAAAHGLRPVLYLGATNIMDLDARRAAWESAGVTVVTTPDDIPA